MPIYWLITKFLSRQWSLDKYVLYNKNRLDHHHHHHHHHHLLARISLTLSRHFSLSFIVSGRSWWLHPVSSRSCCMYVRAGRPAFARPYAGVHWSRSFMSSSLLLLQCPACLAGLTWIVFVMGGRWPYGWCLNIQWICFLVGRISWHIDYCRLFNTKYKWYVNKYIVGYVLFQSLFICFLVK